MLDNIPHIKAFWIATGVELAQTALWFGVDDLDGTVQEEKIYHMAGSSTPKGCRRRSSTRLVRAAGREPLERDTLYNIVNVPAIGLGRRRGLTRACPIAPPANAIITPVQILRARAQSRVWAFSRPDFAKISQVTTRARLRGQTMASIIPLLTEYEKRAPLASVRRCPRSISVSPTPRWRRRIAAARATLGNRLVILGHHYQRDEVIRFADYTGDSFRSRGQIAQPARGRLHRVLRRALHGRERRRALRAASAGHPARPRGRLLDGRHGRARSARDLLGRAHADGHHAASCPVTYINSAASIKAFVGERGGTVCTSSNATATLSGRSRAARRCCSCPDQHLGPQHRLQDGHSARRDGGVGPERDLRRPRRRSRSSARR